MKKAAVGFTVAAFFLSPIAGTVITGGIRLKFKHWQPRLFAQRWCE
jgi:hypothetical protein